MCVNAAAPAAKSLQLCLTLFDPIDSSPSGSPVPEILQARTLEWVAISFSNAWKWKVKVKSLSRVWLLAMPWTAAYQAPPPVGFSMQEYWGGVPLPSPVCVNKVVQYSSNVYHLSSWNLPRYSNQLYGQKLANMEAALESLIVTVSRSSPLSQNETMYPDGKKTTVKSSRIY